MSSIRLPCDIFEFNETWTLDTTISEGANPLVDGTNIIGRAVGPFFIIDGASRNKRFYSRRLWERALENCTESINKGTMIGTIGHDQKLDDEALRNGKVSHRISKLWIDENNKIGMGEVLIFNTPTGQLLNSYLRGGLQLSISSRALGEYVKQQRSDGIQIVNPDNFILEGFDFVRNPGIEFATAKIVESTGLIPNLEIDMSEAALLESLTTDKMKLQGSLNEALKSNQEVSSKLADTESELRATRKLLEKTEEKLRSVEDEQKSLNEGFNTTSSTIAQYENLGTPDELEKVLSLLEEYVKLGTIDEIESLIDRTGKLVEDLKRRPELTPTLKKELLTYRQLGTIREMQEGLSYLQNYAKLGSPKAIAKVLDITEQYVELGSTKEIGKIFKVVESIVGNTKAQTAKRLSESYSAPHETVTNLVEKLGVTGAETALKELTTNKGTTVSQRYTVGKTPTGGVKPITESLNKPSEISGSSLKQSRLERILREH